MILLLLLAVASAPHETHAEKARVEYLTKALDAVRGTPPAQRDRAHEYARVLEQGACASSIERLKVDCLMTASRKYCRKNSAEESSRCQAMMDVVVSNILAGRRLIGSDRRYEIMKRFKDPRRELVREFRRIQGTLAVDLHLRSGDTEDDAASARDIDRYCLTTADETGVEWQSCASSLVWFIATSKP
jgi:hypothetical protein